jgi:type IV pilus assembly protein PilB
MSHPFNHRRLGEVLLDKKYLGQHQLDAALAVSKGLLGETLLSENCITPEQLAEALAEQCGLPYVDLEGFTVPSELFGLISATHAYQYGVVPYLRDGDTLHVVVSDPYDLSLTGYLERLSGLRVRLFVSSARAVAAALKRSEGSHAVLQGVSEDFKLVIVKENDEGKEQYVSLNALGDDTASPVIKLINSILSAAIQKRASDVHIEVYEKGISINYRIDGVLYPATDVLDRRHHSSLVSRLKVMAELDIAEKRTPQDGRFKLRFGTRDIDFRVSILPSVFGEDVVIRILDKSSITDGMKSLRLESLNMAPDILKKFRRSIHEPYGMVLITGPTGSGKTTTYMPHLAN